MDQDEVRQGNAGKCAGGSILGKAGGSGQGGDFRRRSSKLRIHWRSKNGQYDGIHITFQHMPERRQTQKGEQMSNIRFYIPKYETIPTDLLLYVDDTYVKYKRIQHVC